MDFINQARQAGYTDDQIRQYMATALVKQNNSQPSTQTNQSALQSADPTIQGFFDQARKSGYTDDQIKQYMDKKSVTNQLKQQNGEQQSVLSTDAPLSQAFGVYNPTNEVFSSGINTGADLAAPVGTKVALPPGKWQVLDSFSGAVGPGYIGNSVNSGYGNSALVKNIQTGESLRFSHLMQNQLQAGQLVDGGVVFGVTGATGNTTGPHLDLEYRNSQGQLGDVMQSPYAQFLNTNGQ